MWVIRVTGLGEVAGEVLFRIPIALRTWHPDLFTAEALAQRLEDMALIIDAMNTRMALRIGLHDCRPCVRGDDAIQGNVGLRTVRALLTAGILPQHVQSLHDRLMLVVVGLKG